MYELSKWAQMEFRIDLVIPVFGDAPFLKETINSCASSQDTPFNLIWALDRPSEGVCQIVEEFSSKNKFSKIVFSGNPGIVAALNLGIESGMSEYIARLDSDDLMEPNRLEMQRQYLDSERSVGVVGSQMTLINEKNEILGNTKYPCDHSRIMKLLKFQNCMGHPSVMFRRRVFEKVGGYRTQFTGAEDYDLWLRMADLTQLHNLPESLTRYRISNFQFTKRKESNQGIVETAVRLASLGYHEMANRPLNPLSVELRISNEELFAQLKEEDYSTYKDQKSIYFINKAYAIKKKSKRYFQGIGYLAIAFTFSPSKVFSYFLTKFIDPILKKGEKL